MIINGSSRSNGAFFVRHLLRADQNERVAVVDMRGLAYADDVPTAFREMKELAAGTQCKNYFYHANMNTRADEQLTPEQWAQAVDALEAALQLDGQPRFIVEHEKDGRTHRHVIWGRIDADTNTAISDSHNYRTHEQVATALEEAFGHEATQRALTRDKEATPRPEPNVQDWESFRAAESKIDPKAMKAELTELWQHSDNGSAFAAALEERGYILARGDRRDFCVIDQAGDEHSLGRRLSGVKAAEVRARMADIDAAALPSVEGGREMARQRLEEPPQDSSAPAAQMASAEPVDAFAAIMGETKQGVPSSTIDAPQAEPMTTPAPAPASTFDTVMAEARQEAAEETARVTQEERSGISRFERFRAWCGTVREHVAGWGQQAQDYYRSWFPRGEEPAPEPPPQPSQGMEPQL